MSDSEARKKAMRSSIELTPTQHANKIEPTSEPFSHLNPPRPREPPSSVLSTSPPGRSSTLPPIPRSSAPNRPRKQSVSKRAREPQHKRQKSREQAHLRRMSYDRKAYSAEPSSNLAAAYGKRWEDLIDAATSATEEDEERTPVSSFSPLTIPYTDHLGSSLTYISQSCFTTSLFSIPFPGLPSFASPTSPYSSSVPPRSSGTLPIRRER